MIYTISGYKYDTEAEAQSAIDTCNTHFGIPAEGDDVTKNWTEYMTASLDLPVFYYIVAHPDLVPVFGAPSNFDVTFPDED